MGLMHATLEEVLYEALEDTVEVRFGRWLVAIEPGPHAKEAIMPTKIKEVQPPRGMARKLYRLTVLVYTNNKGDQSVIIKRDRNEK